MVASGILQFVFWHLAFFPGVGRCGARQQNSMAGMGMGGGGNNGYQDNYDNQYGGNGNELGREYTRHSKRSRRRRLADVEAYGSSEDQDGPHGLARSPSAGYKSLGRRGKSLE